MQLLQRVDMIYDPERRRQRARRSRSQRAPASHPHEIRAERSTLRRTRIMGQAPSQGSADRHLVSRVCAGEEAARDELAERMLCVPRILSAKNRRMGGPFTPEDLLDLSQETFTLLWKKIGTFQGEATLETWAYQFCYHVFMNALRSRRRQPVAMDHSEELPLEQSEPQADFSDCEALHRALQQIEADEAEVIELKQFSSLTFEEIAEQLSISPNSAKTRYYRGIEKLRRLLRPFFAEKSA
jgi:RNA polymerase sigma-70 factor (ECF subfamily)